MQTTRTKRGANTIRFAVRRAGSRRTTRTARHVTNRSAMPGSGQITPTPTASTSTTTAAPAGDMSPMPNGPELKRRIWCAVDTRVAEGRASSSCDRASFRW